MTITITVVPTANAGGGGYVWQVWDWELGRQPTNILAYGTESLFFTACSSASTTLASALGISLP
jgi:hypothetical protein